MEREPVSDTGASAIRAILALQRAERQYKSAHGHYGELSDLTDVKAGLRPAPDGLTYIAGYQINIRVQNGGYDVLASHPAENGRQFWSFFGDDTEIIRENLAGQATKNSRRIDGRVDR